MSAGAVISQACLIGFEGLGFFLVHHSKMATKAGKCLLIVSDMPKTEGMEVALISECCQLPFLHLGNGWVVHDSITPA